MTDAIKKIYLRLARPDDIERIFQWRNDPFFVKRSTTQRPVTWEEHQSWFARALNNPDQKIFIVVQGDEPIGEVRFDRKGHRAVISVYLVEERTGKGLGIEVIRRGTQAAFREWNIRQVIAYIRQDNLHATRAFDKAGYKASKRARTLPVRSFHLLCFPRGRYDLRARHDSLLGECSGDCRPPGR